jgi:hypothetical protein
MRLTIAAVKLQNVRLVGKLPQTDAYTLRSLAAMLQARRSLISSTPPNE